MDATLRRVVRRLIPILSLACASLVTALPAGAQSLEEVPACESLPAELKKQAQSILASLHPYDGCDETFASCLARKPPHPIVLRLAADVCRQVKAGKTKANVERALARRAQSALPMGRPASFALDEATRAGEASAPVTLVIYACSRCPFCKELIPVLHREVVEGRLRGKVKLYLRPFPLKSHEHSTEADLALLGSARLGRFWPYLLLQYARFDRFDPKSAGAWAAEVGLEREPFERLVADPALRDALAESKKEGIRNKVQATPALFVNGRPYLYELQIEPLVDLLLEEHERASAAGR